METQFAQRPDNNYREGIISTQPENNSAVAWCAVFAGAVASAALSLILLLLGTGFGLTLVSPWSSEGISSTSFGVSSIVGITLISVAASALGGYLAGRLRTRWLNTHNDEVYFRDTAHGFLSWAVATLGTAALLTSVISGIMGSGVKAGAAVAGGAATAATSAIASGTAAALASDNSEGDTTLPYLLDTLLRKDPNTAADTSPQQPVTSPDPVDGAPATEPAPAPQANENTTAAENDAAKGELMRIFVHAVATDSLPQNDVEYAGQLVAQVTGTDQQTAEKRVADSFNTLREKLDEAETAALAAADKAREVTAYTSLWLFISLLSGAFIASLMAIYGGRQRDLN
ncbi:hypothetical protein [Cellvibrio sp. UBA7671]|uniref:hypothetical protein n=1 Tax=Cellvibrio sp. UBA7671 TaxID=1946312 RepID=UPI002F34FF88